MDSNLKDFLLKKYFFIYRVGYRVEKVCEKNKSKIAHNFFVTKAKDLKAFFSKPLKNACRNMCHTSIFV